MDITTCAGLSTVGEECLCDVELLSNTNDTDSTRFGKTCAFDCDFLSLPNPISITLEQLSEYINHVTNWPAILELPNGEALIINSLIGKVKHLRVNGIHPHNEPVYPQYSAVKNIPFDMIEQVRSCMMIMNKEGRQNSDEFKEMGKLLNFFEAMQRGDRFHVDRFIRTCCF
ncbi:MAG: hypothetical protein JXB48_24040 [Candidatus Latescibacteria bacterium]|nr:hypothetical protein [Candidatus Latescibacterota bacterium]